jgi:hypothetical protein
MRRDFFDPTPEQQNVVLIDAATLQKAQRVIAGCEACGEDAEIPFDNILDRLTASDPSVTDYVLRGAGEVFAVRGYDYGKVRQMQKHKTGFKQLSARNQHLPYLVWNTYSWSTREDYES